MVNDQMCADACKVSGLRLGVRSSYESGLLRTCGVAGTIMGRLEDNVDSFQSQTMKGEAIVVLGRMYMRIGEQVGDMKGWGFRVFVDIIHRPLSIVGLSLSRKRCRLPFAIFVSG